jgi:hypothetical protein
VSEEQKGSQKHSKEEELRGRRRPGEESYMVTKCPTLQEIMGLYHFSHSTSPVL